MGVDADAGQFRMPQIFYELDGRRRSRHKGAHQAWLDKSAALRTLPAQVMKKCLPRHGEPRSRVSWDVSHEDLGRHSGYAHRSSYSRAMQNAAPWVKQKRNFGLPSVYHLAIPEGDHQLAKGEDGTPYDALSFVYPSAAELARRKDELGEMAARADKWKSELRYRWSPEWWLHPNFPGSPHQRAVFGALVRHGLLDVENGRIKGVIEGISMARLARDTGLSEATVRRALWFYSDSQTSRLNLQQVLEAVDRRQPLKVDSVDGEHMRVMKVDRRHCPRCVAPGKRQFEPRGKRDRNGRLVRFLKRPDPQCPTCGGKGKVETARRGIGLLRLVIQPGAFVWDERERKEVWVQEPLKIIYLPGGDFDIRKASLLVKQFQDATRRWHASVWYAQMQRIHATVLKEYVGTQRRIDTFRRECAERMKKAGIPQEAIQAACYAHGPP